MQSFHIFDDRNITKSITDPSRIIHYLLKKNSILKLEGIIKKLSSERRDYESVDEKSLS